MHQTLNGKIRASGLKRIAVFYMAASTVHQGAETFQMAQRILPSDGRPPPLDIDFRTSAISKGDGGVECRSSSAANGGAAICGNGLNLL